MSQSFRTFSLTPGNQANTMAVAQVVDGNIANALPAAPTAIVVVPGQEPTLIVYDSTVAVAQAYTLDAGSIDLTPAAAYKIGTGWDILEPFINNNSPYLMCYRSSDGTFAFFKLAQPLANPVTFSLTHNPGVTKGYTSVKPFLTLHGPAFLGYNQANGSVALYSFAANSSNPTCVWAHQWAKGWTRFAFFQFGGENFFFKINVDKLNVNIDHVLDDLALGTVEVGTELPLDNALGISSVAALNLANGDPHFITYQTSGAATVNRFNGNCLGWTKLATWNTLQKASHVVPFQIASEAYVLFA